MAEPEKKEMNHTPDSGTAGGDQANRAGDGGGRSHHRGRRRGHRGGAQQHPQAAEQAGQPRPQATGQPANRPAGQAPSRPAGQNSNRPTGHSPNRPAGQNPNRPAGQNPNRPAGQNSNRPTGQGANRPAGQRPNRPPSHPGPQQPPRSQGPRPNPPRPASSGRPAGAPRAAAPEAQPVAPQAPAAALDPVSNTLVLPEMLTIRDLATMMRRSPIDIIKELMKNGVMANINQQIDYETAAIVAEDMGFVVEHEKAPEPEPAKAVAVETRKGGYTEEEYARLPVRPPVVTVLGHVDHGKTSLLDAIRQTNVVAGEVGGITQHIGAYQVEKQGKLITFLDTPGHEAFTAMRARGAKVTDIAILVVAADDGVMPQTLEAIDHARAANVPIIIALNKIDKENANPDYVKQQLAEVDLVVEDYGGQVICVPVSAKQRIGIENLLEMVLLVAEMADLRANPDRAAKGTVIEGRLDKARGPMATLLVADGTLRTGDNLVIGGIAGKVRAMFDDKGQRIDAAPPATPAAVLGLPDVPEAGMPFEVVADDRTARTMAADYALAHKSSTEQAPARPVTLEEFYAHAAEGKVKELNLILKADVQGSIEPIENSLSRLGDENLKARLLLKGTGNITESDVSLAIASNAIIIGFSVQVDPAAARFAEANGVDIRIYDIIYRLTEDIEKALKGLLEPVYQDVTIGHAEVRQTFHIPKVGTIAGSIVTDGTAARNARVRVMRGGKEIYDGRVSSLKRFTEDVREVATGYECGVGIEGFDALEPGDILEFYRKERVSG